MNLTRKQFKEIISNNKKEWSELVKYMKTKPHYTYCTYPHQIEVTGDFPLSFNIKNPTEIESFQSLLCIDGLSRIPNKVIFVCDGHITIENLKCLKIPRQVTFICTGTVTIEDLNIDTREMGIKGISGVKYLNYLIEKGFYE
jgi:hypothetical protein